MSGLPVFDSQSLEFYSKSESLSSESLTNIGMFIEGGGNDEADEGAKFSLLFSFPFQNECWRVYFVSISAARQFDARKSSWRRSNAVNTAIGYIKERYVPEGKQIISPLSYPGEEHIDIRRYSSRGLSMSCMSGGTSPSSDAHDCSSPSTHITSLKYPRRALSCGDRFDGWMEDGKD